MGLTKRVLLSPPVLSNKKGSEGGGMMFRFPMQGNTLWVDLPRKNLLSPGHITGAS